MKPGAYGLRLGGDSPGSELLAQVPDGAPIVTIKRRTGQKSVPNHVDESRATVPLIDGGGIEMRRADRSANITTPQELSDDELVHPYLAPVAAVHSHWLGRAAFHAGGIVLDGRAWGVVGIREAGKSTLLAALDDAGVTVMSDDLFVVAGSEAFAGPRTLDLRPGAAKQFRRARQLGVAGARERWRLDLGAAPTAAPLAGWVVPQWGDTVRIWREPGAAAAHHIAPARSVGGIAISPQAFLEAAAKPAVVFERPRDFAALRAGSDALISSLRALAV